MGRRHAIERVTRSWALLRFDLSDDEAGFLLDHAGRLCSEAGRVLAFPTRVAALAYARLREPTLESIPHGRFYDLRAVEAFVDRRSPAFPAAALDVWSVLGEVAHAVGREVPALRHASLPAVTGTGSSLLEPMRVALAAGLDAFRDVVRYAEQPPLLVAAPTLPAARR